MNFDCFAFVDVKDKTLLTRAATTPMERVLEDLDALHQKEDVSGPIFVKRSYTNAAGDEVATELYTEAALRTLQDAPEAPLAKVQILHARNPSFFCKAAPGETFSARDYVLQAVLLVPKSESLSRAYRYSQNIDAAWNPGNRSRSSSVGDIFVADGEAYMIANVGYVPVVLGE